jgi:hypothetical protein
VRVPLAAALQVRIVEGQASQNWPLKSTPHRCSREEGEKKCVLAFLAAWVADVSLDDRHAQTGL